MTAGGLTPLRSNVEALMTIQAPTNHKELHSFLSTANYYLKFVPNFSNVSEPLRKLLRQSVHWEWNSHQQNAFEQIKEEIAGSRVLGHFDINCKTLVTTDASSVALGAVLSQIQNGKDVPIAFASGTLSPTERNY